MVMASLAFITMRLSPLDIDKKCISIILSKNYKQALTLFNKICIIGKSYIPLNYQSKELSFTLPHHEKR
ncbi:hypothetical protein SPPR111872_07475 [Sphingobacterium prati]